MARTELDYAVTIVRRSLVHVTIGYTQTKTTVQCPVRCLSIVRGNSIHTSHGSFSRSMDARTLSRYRSSDNFRKVLSVDFLYRLPLNTPVKHEVAFLGREREMGSKNSQW